MSDVLGRIADLEPAASVFNPSLWIVAAIAALCTVFCLMAFNHAGGREGTIAALASAALALIGAGVAVVAFEGSSRRDVAAERRGLDFRVQELTMRAAMPGSALACLDAVAGDTVEAACEKALFQTPEATAAAVTYVTVQLALLADLAAHAGRPGARVPVALGNLRRAIEADRFGLVAHVLAARDGCVPESCAAFALVGDSNRIAINLAERTYDLYVTRHSAAWPVSAKTPVAAVGAVSSVVPTAGVTAGRDGLFFPSAASIPPVNIMSAEPPTSAETTGATAPSVTRGAPTPPRRPSPSSASSSGQPSAQARPPIDLNAAPR